MCYYLQSYSGYKSVEVLLDILLRRDSELVPVFCQALVDTDQTHVAARLGFKGWLSEASLSIYE